MKVNYNPLFKLLIDRRMKKGELVKQAEITYTTLAKMAKGENITVEVIAKICKVLNVTPNDIMEVGK